MPPGRFPVRLTVAERDANLFLPAGAIGQRQRFEQLLAPPVGIAEPRFEKEDLLAGDAEPEACAFLTKGRVSRIILFLCGRAKSTARRDICHRKNIRVGRRPITGGGWSWIKGRLRLN